MPGWSSWTACANSRASPMSGVDVSNQRTSAYGAQASERAIAGSSPGRTRKKPSGVRSPVRNSWSVGSTSLVRSVALSASVRATRIVGTPATSAASRAAFSVRMNCAGRDEHLAAEVAALLLRCELIVRSGRPPRRLRSSLASARRPAAVRRSRPRRRRRSGAASRPAVLRPPRPGPREERVVQTAHEGGRAVGRVEALIGIRLAGEVRVGRDLPAGEVDRLQSGLRHLHRLAAGQGAESGDVLVAVQELPEAFGSEPSERVLDGDGAAEALDVGRRIRPLDPAPAVGRSTVRRVAVASSGLCCLVGLVVALAVVRAGAISELGGAEERSSPSAQRRVARLTEFGSFTRQNGSNEAFGIPNSIPRPIRRKPDFGSQTPWILAR